jgi:hypothetical protein
MPFSDWEDTRFIQEEMDMGFNVEEDMAVNRRTSGRLDGTC